MAGAFYNAWATRMSNEVQSFHTLYEKPRPSLHQHNTQAGMCCSTGVVRTGGAPADLFRVQAPDRPPPAAHGPAPAAGRHRRSHCLIGERLQGKKAAVLSKELCAAHALDSCEDQYSPKAS